MRSASALVRSLAAPKWQTVVAPSAVMPANNVRWIFGQSFDKGELRVASRSRADTGTRAVKKLRADNKLPGILYGFDANGVEERVLLTVETKVLNREYAKRGAAFENTLYDLHVDDNKVDVPVLPRQLILHPTKDTPEAITFMRYIPGARPGARISIPLKLINEDKCPAVRDGGWPLHLIYSLDVFARGESIPDCLIVDLRGKRIGDKVRASEVHLNDGLTLRSRRTDDFAVVKLMGSKRLASAADDEE